MENIDTLDKYLQERERVLALEKEESKQKGPAHFAVDLSQEKFKEIYKTAIEKIRELDLPPHNERFAIIQLEQLLGMKYGKHSEKINKINYNSVYCLNDEIKRIIEDTINELFDAKVLNKNDLTLVHDQLTLTIKRNEEIERELAERW